MPVLVPAILLATMTLSPTASAPPPARLVVLSAGDRVGAGEADRRRSDTLPEGLAVPTLEDLMGQHVFDMLGFTCFPFAVKSLWSQQPLCSSGENKRIKIEVEVDVSNLMSRESVATGEDSVHGRAGEILFPPNGAIVLSQGGVQLDAGPFSGSKLGFANVANCTRLRASHPNPVPDNKCCLKILGNKVMARCIKRDHLRCCIATG